MQNDICFFDLHGTVPDIEVTDGFIDVTHNGHIVHADYNFTPLDIEIVYPSGASFISPTNNMGNRSKILHQLRYGKTRLMAKEYANEYEDCLIITERIERPFQQRYVDRESSSVSFGQSVNSVSLAAAHKKVNDMHNSRKMQSSSPTIIHRITRKMLDENPTGLYIPHLGITVGYHANAIQNKYLANMIGGANRKTSVGIDVKVLSTSRVTDELYVNLAGQIMPVHYELDEDGADRVIVTRFDSQGNCNVIAEGELLDAINDGIPIKDDDVNKFKLYRTIDEAHRADNEKVENHQKKIDQLEMELNAAKAAKHKAEGSLWHRIVQAVATLVTGLGVLKGVLSFYKP